MEVAMLTRVLFVLGLGAALATPAFSQHHHGPRGQQGPGAGPQGIPVEAALRHREQLKLTEKQVADITVLREESLKARQQHMAAMMELSSKVRAGELSREEFQTQMRARRDAVAPTVRQRSDRLNGILDQTQQSALRDMVRTDRQGMGWRAEHHGTMGGPRGRPR
jgi:hypothetical protein